MRALNICLALAFAASPAPVIAAPSLPAASTPTSTPKIVTDAQAAADWVATALTASGYKADFTPQSLAEIDRFLDDQAPHGHPLAGGPLADGLGGKIFALGAYVGETLRRQHNGTWVGDDKDPKAEINIALILPDGTRCWPVQRVMKRFQNGTEDSIAAYGAALATTARRAR